jgi:hypothetical protein
MKWALTREDGAVARIVVDTLVWLVFGALALALAGRLSEPD